MARKVRSAKLETRTARLKLAQRDRPYPAPVGPGVVLHYRRGARTSTWTARLTAAATASKDRTIWLGLADDFADADGDEVLDYWQASDKARAAVKLYEGGTTNEPITVARALDDYEADLKVRGGGATNARRARNHLTPVLLERLVGELKSSDLRRWRDALTKTLTPASVNRVATGLRAALNLAADHDERIARRAWEVGLAALHGASRARNVVLDDRVVRNIVAEAYRPRPLEHWIITKADAETRARAEAEAAAWAKAFGLMVEVLAVTGTRISQAARLEIGDLQDGRSDPRLLMPSSRKGKGEKRIIRRPVPIPASLAAKLRAAAGRRPVTAPLLAKPGGDRWRQSDHSRPFARVLKRLRAADEVGKLDSTSDGGGTSTAWDEITIYALRHSSIVRALLASVPLRVVADLHDTSAAMVEKNYSRFIADHADTVARRGLLDTAAPGQPNVVPFVRTGA